MPRVAAKSFFDSPDCSWIKLYRFVSVSIDNSVNMVYILFTIVNYKAACGICKGGGAGAEAKMAKILVGTCGYGYNEWVGPVYPEGTKPAARLSLYSRLFRAVELDHTYYGMPKAANLAKMLVAGGPALTFSIKAYRTLTHEINPSLWKENAKTYREAIEPVLQAGRLEAVLFQFPPKFAYEADQRRYLDKLLAYFKGVPAAVEFRMPEWYTNRVIEGMKERGVSLVSLDMPALEDLPPLMDVVTAPFSYIRLHGRNGESWHGSDEVARYDYLYNDQELEAWADRIKRIAVQADRILVYFNNHARGQAVKNAQSLIAILDRAGLWDESKEERT
jgi:uncharacterized protein YecE (DUF72 family)